MQRGKRITRRRFLSRSTTTLAAAGASSLAFPARLRAAGANERITVGVIGAGGRGQADMRATMGADNVVVGAACDVAEFRLKQAVDHTKGQPGGPAESVYSDYRRVLDRKDIDAVIIATPDHWHRRPFIDALSAGKHIYQEKPMSHTIEGGRKMVEVAKAHPKSVVQIGTQRRSGTHYLEAKALIEQGKLGEIYFVRAYDCRNWTRHDPFAPRPYEGKIDWDRFQEPCSHKVPLDPHRYFAWRWFWDYAGGLVTDVGVHVMDVVHWLTGKDMPRTAVCNGGVYALKYWETPDVVNAVWDYGTHSVSFTANFTNGFQGDGLTIYGSEATMEIRGEHITVYAEPSGRDRSRAKIAEFPPKGVKHQVNWINCIRSGETPNAPVELGFQSLLPSHLANLAYRRGSRVAWDAGKHKVV